LTRHKSNQDLKSAWAVVEAGAKQGAFAGAVGLVSKEGKILLHESCGFASIYPAKIRMSKNAIFDLASITKAVATTTAIMVLLERGTISLDDKVGSYLPEFTMNGSERKKSITVKHLLTHTSGLPSWSDLYKRHSSRNSLLEEILTRIDPIAEPGSSFAYSDIGFILLGQITEAVSGKRLDRFAEREIFRPLGMKDTCYNPKAGKGFVSTEYSNWRGKFVRGEVHDENAFAMGGVSGHAGLFSTASDLCLFCENLLDDRARILSKETLKLFTSDYTSSLGGYLGLGWWVKTKTTPDIGSLLPTSSFGHHGYTGAAIWNDPESKTAIILLTNRVHPVREGDPESDKSVGIMMARKYTWGKVNKMFQDGVIRAVSSQET
jgi:CubicO group peptidase (beta-lactamase class C family)